MHLLIDGLGSRIGGGMTGMVGLVEALLEVAPYNNYSILLSSVYQQKLIKRFSGRINVIPIQISTSLLPRTYFHNITLNSLIPKIKADVVYFSGEASQLYCCVPSIMLCGNLSLFVSASESAIMSRKLAIYKLFRKPIALCALKNATRIGFVSQEICNIVLRISNIPADKTFLMPHGISRTFHEKFSSLEWRKMFGDVPYILSVSAINRNKGYDVLISAYASLSSEAPPLVIAGPAVHKPTYAMIMKMIKKLGLEKRVFLLGHVLHERLPSLYQGASLFIFPTYLESFGIPLIEAMASGLPIITSDLNICKEVCDDAVAYFRTGDEGGLKQRMIEVMGSVELKKELSAKARQRAKNFTWESTASRFITVAEEICS